MRNFGPIDIKGCFTIACNVGISLSMLNCLCTATIRSPMPEMDKSLMESNFQSMVIQDGPSN